MSNFNRFNPCRGESLDTPVVRYWAWLNGRMLKGVDCVCCAFYRGLAVGLVIGWVAL